MHDPWQMAASCKFAKGMTDRNLVDVQEALYEGGARLQVNEARQGGGEHAGLIFKVYLGRTM